MAPKIEYVSSLHGGIAQLGERLNGIQEVSGSIPLISTIRDTKGLLQVLEFEQQQPLK